MHAIRHQAFWLACLLLYSLCCSLAAAEEEQFDRWFSLTLDNDLFTGTDGGYTNGLYASWFTVVPEGQASHEVPWYFWIQSKLINPDATARQLHIHNVSQTMVTPSDIQLLPPDANDSPYAGLLFWQGSILSVEGRITDYSTVLLGILGPASLAEQSQKIVHKATGSDRPQGWDYQLGNEALIGMQHGRLWRLYESRKDTMEFDLIAGTNGILSNLITAVEGGLYFRIGHRLESSYPVFALASNREINPTAHSGGWFAYVGFGALYLFHDLLVDRHTEDGAKTFSSDNYDESLSVGAAVSGQRWGFSINLTETGVFGDPEAGASKFGSFTFLRKLR